MTDPEPRDAGSFAATRWTLVQRAQGDSEPARAALAELCSAYWQPVFRFLCRDGHDSDSARELTQEFFSRILARGGLGAPDRRRGRFRSYLLGAVKHFLSDERDRARRAKRGGGLAPASLDGGPAGQEPPEIPDPAQIPPDVAFDRQWALTVIERSLVAVESELAAAGKSTHFDVLKPWLTGDSDDHTQASAAEALDMKTGAVKVAIHRLRQRFRAAVMNEIQQTVDSESDARSELNYLLSVL